VFVNFRGRRKAKRVGVGTAGKRAAETAVEKIQAQLTLGNTALLDETRVPIVTFAEHAERWLRSYVAVHLKPSTQEMYETVLTKHWKPAIGSSPLNALTRERIKAHLGTLLGSGLSTSRVKGALNVLRACLTAAVEDGLIPRNPAARLGRFAGRTGEVRELEIFSAEELTKLLDTAEREVPEHYPLLLTLARTGLRIGEALTLRVEDPDFTRRELWVRRTWGSRKKALGDRRINAPKSNRFRRVDMSRQLCRVLQSHLTLREAEAVVRGQEDAAWVFADDRGQPLTPGAFWQNTWRALLNRAEVRYRKPHALRHTFASLLITQGESLAYVRHQMGHHSIKMTVDVYGHLMPGANKAAVDRLDDATGRNPYATTTLVR
jgi:integrase